MSFVKDDHAYTRGVGAVAAMDAASPKRRRAVARAALAMARRDRAMAKSTLGPRGRTMLGSDPPTTPTTSSDVRSPTRTASDVRSPTRTRTSTEVRSPTSTSTEVRSPTSTSTDAYTQGNVTVTGGAGAGATIVNICDRQPGQSRRADEAAHLARSRGAAGRPQALMRETGASRPGSPIPGVMDSISGYPEFAYAALGVGLAWLLLKGD